MLGVWFCSSRVHYELVKRQTGYREAMKHASEGESVYTLRLHKDFRYSENTTRYHTIPPTRVHQSQSIMLKASHAHTNRQLILTKESSETNKHLVCFMSLSHLRTLKRFSLHIHETYSLSRAKAQDFKVSTQISNMVSGYRFVTQTSGENH